MSAATAVVVRNPDGRTPPYSDHQIHSVARRGPQDIAKWEQSIARDRGISVRHLPNHNFVKAVSRLSDDAVDLDPIEELLVALGRAGILSSFQRGLLQIHYLR